MAKFKHRDNGYTAEQFERDYAQRSGVAVDWLRQMDRVVAPCDCAYEECEGWALVSKDHLEDHLRFYAPASTSPEGNE